MTVHIVPRATTYDRFVPTGIDVPGGFIEREKIQVDTGDGHKATMVGDWLVYDKDVGDNTRVVTAVVAAEAVLALYVVDTPPEVAAERTGPIGAAPPFAPGGGTYTAGAGAIVDAARAAGRRVGVWEE